MPDQRQRIDVYHHVDGEPTPTESAVAYGCRRVMGWGFMAVAAGCGWAAWHHWSNTESAARWWYGGAAALAFLVAGHCFRPRE